MLSTRGFGVRHMPFYLILLVSEAELNKSLHEGERGSGQLTRSSGADYGPFSVCGRRRVVGSGGKNAGELRSETEPELLNDAIFGAIYYRLLLRSGPLTKRFGEELVEQVLRGHRSAEVGRIDQGDE
jgi:hypothetical protein